MAVAMKDLDVHLALLLGRLAPVKVIQIYSNEQSHERRMHKPRTEQRDAKPKGW